jgi:hypothetical protein
MKKYLKIKNFICKLLSINGKTEKKYGAKALLKKWPFWSVT